MTRRRSVQSLLVMRCLLLSNGLILAVISSLYLLYGSRPSGYVVGGVLGAGAVGLWAAVPLTDPYRRERS